MTILYTGPECFNLLLAGVWDAAHQCDPATIDLLAEPPSTPNESHCRSRSSLLSSRKSGTIGDNKERPRHDRS